MARPPTPGGGPLNSHPTTPIGHITPPVFPEPDEEHIPAPVDSPLDLSSTKSIETTVTVFPPSLEEAAAAYAAAGAAPSLRTSRPASAHLTHISSRSPEPADTKPSSLPRSTSGGLKRLLSLSSLRHGFQTSRTSSDLSTLTTGTNASTTWFASTPSTKRRSSIAKSPDATQAPRKRSSGAWFRRASVMWSDERADSVVGDAYVLGAGEGRKDSVPRGGAPMLPEIPELGIRANEDWGAGLRADIGAA